MQDISLNQLKLKTNDTSKKDLKFLTSFEPSNDEDFLNKTYLGEKRTKMERQISDIEKHYNEFKLHNNKQYVDKNLTERAVKTTIQIFYVKGLSDE